MDLMVIFELLRNDGNIAVNKALAHSIGVHESLILGELISRCVYFMNKKQLTEDGFFFNTIADLQSGTALGEKSQRTAIKQLATLGLIQVENRGVPKKRYFKISLTSEMLNALILDGKKKADEIEPRLSYKKRKEAETCMDSQYHQNGGMEDEEEKRTETLAESQYHQNGGTSTTQTAVPVPSKRHINNTNINNTNLINEEEEEEEAVKNFDKLIKNGASQAQKEKIIQFIKEHGIIKVNKAIELSIDAKKPTDLIYALLTDWIGLETLEEIEIHMENRKKVKNIRSKKTVKNDEKKPEKYSNFYL